jgi:hypothetical protein
MEPTLVYLALGSDDGQEAVLGEFAEVFIAGVFSTIEAAAEAAEATPYATRWVECRLLDSNESEVVWWKIEI